MAKPRNLSQWRSRAKREMLRVLAQVREVPLYKKMGPKAKTWTVDVEVLGLSAMRTLNLKYRRKSRPTDVLSFPSAEPFFSQGILGSVVVCAPVVVTQAWKYDHSPEEELSVLLVHGVLHLLGMDHEKSITAARAMAKAEREVLSSLRVKRSRGLLARRV